ncbi:MAG: autorepressor SdpR family transcription factor [Butyrivibrio sp.]|nr:autorepressor SdpR family transcription factor [Butyrivibrio sp.]
MAIGNTFKALSEPARRQILVMLRDGRLAAGDIAKRLEMTPAALSYHLSMLKRCDLVTEYKVKNYVYYELNTSVLDEVMLWFKELGGAKNENKDKASVADNNAADDNNGGSGSIYA